MDLMNNIKDLKIKIDGSSSSNILQTTRNWYNDRYEWMQVQRSLLFLVTIVSAVAIIILTLSISYIKNTRSIEPFVIEIEQKTGVPTVVEPLTAKAYSGQDAIKRYFVWKYIKTREEYTFATYSRAFKEVSYMSSPEVYSDYRRFFNSGNPQSPYNLLADTSIRTVELKSIIFQDEKTAQVRLKMLVTGSQVSQSDKIVYIEFAFENLEMNDEQRFVNPLGFLVKNYRIEDERL
jgi:type IV secretion system protein VirB8